MCRNDVVEFLLEKGASTSQKNSRGESAIDVVSSPWNDELAKFYTGIGTATGVAIDLERIQSERPKIADLLREQRP